LALGTAMKFRLPSLVDWLLDGMACLLFPSKKYLNHTLVIYTVLATVVVVWYTSNWLWVPAMALSMVFAWMLLEWVL
jgi:hypothetical protein